MENIFKLKVFSCFVEATLGRRLNLKKIFTKCSVGNLILLQLSTAGVIAPVANLPLALLTPVANYCRCRHIVGKFTSSVTVIGVNLGKDVITTPAVNLPPVPTDAGGHFVVGVNDTSGGAPFAAIFANFRNTSKGRKRYYQGPGEDDHENRPSLLHQRSSGLNEQNLEGQCHKILYLMSSS